MLPLQRTLQLSGCAERKRSDVQAELDIHEECTWPLLMDPLASGYDLLTSAPRRFEDDGWTINYSMELAQVFVMRSVLVVLQFRTPRQLYDVLPTYSFWLNFIIFR
jgi:hypothetical protein